jgi:hypothetical protein
MNHCTINVASGALANLHRAAGIAKELVCFRAFSAAKHFPSVIG